MRRPHRVARAAAVDDAVVMAVGQAIRSDDRWCNRPARRRRSAGRRAYHNHANASVCAVKNPPARGCPPRWTSAVRPFSRLRPPPAPQGRGYRARCGGNLLRRWMGSFFRGILGCAGPTSAEEVALPRFGRPRWQGRHTVLTFCSPNDHTRQTTMLRGTVSEQWTSHRRERGRRTRRLRAQRGGGHLPDHAVHAHG